MDREVAEFVHGPEEDVASLDGDQPPYPTHDERIEGKAEGVSGLDAGLETKTPVPGVGYQANPLRWNPRPADGGD